MQTIMRAPGYPSAFPAFAVTMVKSSKPSCPASKKAISPVNKQIDFLVDDFAELCQGFVTMVTETATRKCLKLLYSCVARPLW